MSDERNPGSSIRRFGVKRKLVLAVATRVKGKKSNQGSKASILSYIPFIFLTGSAYALIEVKDSFKDHHINKWISVAVLLILCFLQATRKKIATNQNCWAIRYSQIIEGFYVLSGGLATVSLLSVFLSVPDRFGWLYVGIWLLLALIVVASHFFKFLYTWICWEKEDIVLPSGRCFA